jgi:hypothetical protein
MSARPVASQLHAVEQAFVKALEESMAASRISSSHSPQVPLIGSTGDEFRERFLLQGCGVPIT